MDFTTTSYPFAKGRLFITTAIGLMLPVTVWGAVRFAADDRVADSAFLAFVSVPLLVLDVWVWSRLLTSRPALVLGDGVLVERASLFWVGRVERAAITSVRVAPAGFWQGVVIEFDGRRGWLGRESTTVPALLLGMSADSLADDIRRWLVADGRPA